MSKKIIVTGLLLLTFCACGSLVSIKGPSFGESCGDGQVNTGGSVGGVKVGPFVDIQGPSINHCVDAASVQKSIVDANSTSGTSDVVLLQNETSEELEGDAETELN